YRTQNMKERPPSRAKAIQLMAKEPNLIRRPVVMRGSQMVLGFDEEGYKKLLKSPLVWPGRTRKNGGEDHRPDWRARDGAWNSVCHGCRRIQNRAGRYLSTGACRSDGLDPAILR